MTARQASPRGRRAPARSVFEAVLGACLVLVLIALPVATYSICRARLARHAVEVTPFKREPGVVFVAIEPGMGGAEAVRALEREGMLADAGVALGILARSGQARALRAGEYRFERPLTVREVLERLVKGDVFLRSITLPEGLNRYEIARRFAAEGLGQAEEFLRASASAGLIADLDPRATDLEGYLFPDTYRFGRTEGAEALVRRMVEGFRAALGADAAERAALLGLELREAVILASLVEKETARPEERPLVAGVYLSRLRRGMLLQADPTVIYGLLRAGRYHGNLTRAHLREPGEYNTYARAGLPPGPIANPGRAAIDAALSPRTSEYLYFVSRNDGSHVFARTLAEHNRNVHRHQRLYWRERWRREREGGR